MSKFNVNVNQEDEFDSIHLDETDEVFKYTMIPNDLIRDQSISPNCRWLIMFLLSNKTNSNIKISQVIEHTKGFFGQDKVRKLMNEAKKYGYNFKESRDE